MLFATLAATSADVAATRSRLAKRALIAAAIRQAVPAEPAVPGVPPDQADTAEVALVVTYLSGSLRQRRTGVGWASLTSLPRTGHRGSARPSPMSTLPSRTISGAGRCRVPLHCDPAAVESLFGRATEPEQRLLRGLVFDEIRQGALDSLVQDGLAEAFGVPAKAVQRAAMLLGSTAAAARGTRRLPGWTDWRP